MDVLKAVKRAFNQSNILNELLDTIEEYEEDYSYYVGVLQFKQQIPGLHWSIFLESCSGNDEGGQVYDVFYDPVIDKWKKAEIQASKLTHITSRWASSRRWLSSYHGVTELGTINNLPAFQRIIKSTPLPGQNEDCQTWVKKVIETAVVRGLLDEDALRALRLVPCS